MKCGKCGKETEDNLRFCPACGAPVQGTGNTVIGKKKLSNLALASVAMTFWPIISPAAFICGVLAMKACKRDPNLWGYGLALAGCIVSGIEMLVYLARLVGGLATGAI